MRLPSELAAAIAEQTAAVEARALARAAQEVSARYRGAPPGRAPAFSAVERVAYLAVRVPATFAAASAALAQVRQQMPGLKIHSLLDLGAGAGTAAWAAAQVFPELERIELVEKDATMLVAGQSLAESSSHAALRNACWRQAGLSEPSGDHGSNQEYDLIVFSYVLGELPAAQRAAALRLAWQQAAKLAVVVEPGTPRGYETVLAARAEFIRLGAQVVAPCPHQRACPMSEMAGEWCHFAQRLERSAAHRRLKAATLGYEDEKYAYVAASRAPAARAQARVVRHPRHGRGRVELALCAPAGLQKQTVTRRQKQAFRAARRVKWGDAWPPISAQEDAE